MPVVAADLIIENARVVAGRRGAMPASAVAIAGNRIVAVGSRADVAGMKGPGTRVVDAGGATVMPGFVESHLHVFGGAADLDKLQLGEVEGFEALRDAVRAYAASKPNEGLLIAKGANYSLLGKDTPLTRHHLDQILPDRPLFLIAPDHHTGWANTLALKQAGILEGRKLGVGNEIVMGDDGLALGELRESEAMTPLQSLRTSGGRERLGLLGTEPGPELTAAERAGDVEIMRAGLKFLASHGITSFHNMDGNYYQLELLRTLEENGELTCRAQIPFHLTNVKPLSSLEEASEMARRYRSDKLKSGMVKIFIDGVLDSGTAVLVEDYSDQPGWKGELLFTPEEFAAAATEIDRRGLQIAVHAIGDGAVRTVLDGYAAARRANGMRDSRHRIEHVELIHPADIKRFAELGVIASMQPPHPPGCMGFPLEPTLSKIGRKRWEYAYAWRTLRNAGARLCLASDWPVSPVPPLLGIHAAVNRTKWADDLPDQAMTLDEAIEGYTYDGAYAGFVEDKLGFIGTGRLADLVMLDGDIEGVDPQAINSLKVAMTVCDGQVVYEA